MEEEKGENEEDVTCRRILDVVIILLFECCHSLGTALLVYAVLPDIDSIKGLMLTNCVAFMPGLLGKVPVRLHEGFKT